MPQSFKPKLLIALLAGMGVLFLLIGLVLLSFAIHNWQAQQSYKPGHCTITAKQLLWEISSTSGSNTKHSTQLLYAPDFNFIVYTANGGSYRASGYDGSGTYDSSQSSQQAILDAYAIGHTYSCWYDPSNPTNAVLVRNPNWLFFIVSTVFIIVGIVLTLVSILILLRRPSLT